MDVGGFSWVSVEVIGVTVLGVVLLWAVIKGSRRNKGEASVETSERATRDLYAEEEKRRDAGTDTKPE